ncbi:hypothetical protein EZV62_026178 [Acer yangbiense]|uniref:Cytochrome P450 n=1 Tax=Acer yangbiense TaxID=1000413 RepID=A0A5C7GQ11_9ROSI|nr:hypothetical protein EZV62_026178 [Acer yangbiense]
MDVFLGSIDTTSITLVWAMTELIKNPRVMKKLQAEIRSFVGKNKPLVEEAVCNQNLKYLKMVFKETLRFENEAIEFGAQNFEFLPFGSGRRICPGITMATISLEFVLGILLYQFDWKLPDGMEREDLSMEEEYGLYVHKKIPLCLVPIKYNW